MMARVRGVMAASSLYDEAEYLRDYETFKRELPKR